MKKIAALDECSNVWLLYIHKKHDAYFANDCMQDIAHAKKSTLNVKARSYSNKGVHSDVNLSAANEMSPWHERE